MRLATSSTRIVALNTPCRWAKQAQNRPNNSHQAFEGAPSAQGTVIWTLGPGQPGFDIWDATLHDLGGAWYMYFAADGCSGCYSDHTIYALKGPSEAAAPTQGPWTFGYSPK